MIPTSHIAVKDKSLIAKTVLMPGDPLRAKYIAEKFLTNAVQISAIRNMFGYTGEYNGKSVTVFGSGMGMPSMGIYSYELFKFYDVDNIIRIGSAGAYTKDLSVFDTFLVEKAWSESTYAKTQSGELAEYLKPSSTLTKKLEDSAKKLNINVVKGCIHSADVFYREKPEEYKDIYEKHGCMCVEMEAFALFHNANVTKKNAACILTISDSLVTHEGASAIDREQKLNDMIKITLNSL